jgi:hypothetical protein
MWREFEPQALVKLQLLQMYFPEFAKLLERQGGGDPVAEFLDYEVAREALLGGAIGESERGAIDRTLRSQGLANVVSEEHQSAELRTLIEENALVQFRDPDRVALLSTVKGLADEADWPRLRAALAAGVLPSPSDVQFDKVDIGNRLRGLRVVWVDDEVAPNQRYIDYIREAGAELVTASDTAELELQLDRGFFDVLISDITRGDDPDAGFEAVDLLRAADRLPSSVIFFTSRATQVRLRRAKKLGAALTTDPQELYSLLEVIARSRYPELGEEE